MTPLQAPQPPLSVVADLAIAVPSIETDGTAVPGGTSLAPDNAVAVLVDCPGGITEQTNGDGGGDCLGDEVGVEKVCRICHLMSDYREEEEGTELMQIGCACKGELGCAHRQCAEAWFRLRGNRFCEICGLIAENINGLDDLFFMEAWHEERSLEVDSRNSSGGTNNVWRGRCLCKILLVCFALGFIIPWLIHIGVL